MTEAREEFVREVALAFKQRSLIALVLSRPASGGEQLPSRQDVRPVEVSGRWCCQWTVRVGKQELHENVGANESALRVAELLLHSYRDAHLRTTEADWDLRSNRRGEQRLTRKFVGRAPVDTAHNRRKSYLIPEGEPCPFLEAIGVMTPEGQVRRQKEHKFRQINRYLEIVSDILPALPETGTLQVIDFGCGKSGLTFALYHLLTAIAGRQARVIGLDWNADVLEQCQQTAASLGFAGLSFTAGDIASFVPATDFGQVHLAVSLHACDTATDDAIAKGIAWGADVILAVPCCQHELAPAIVSPALGAVLRHGILRERFAAIATDALRGAWLDAAGYQTQILEFIDLEHTPKNLLIRAVRQPVRPSTAIQATPEIQELMLLLGAPEGALARQLQSANRRQ